MAQDVIADLIKRVEILEKQVLKKGNQIALPARKTKTITLAELARNSVLKNANGQQKIAVIIGYYEKIANEGPSKGEKIKTGWTRGKFQGKYNPVFIHRAVGTLVRDLEDGTYDLTQAGEDFFDSVYNE